MPAGHLASLFGAEGPNLNLPHGLRRQQPGDRRGGRDHPPRRGGRDALRRGALDDPPLRRDRFNLLTALSTRNDEPQRASRPFDRDRDGFVLGEGAGMVVLESLEGAQARGRKSTERSWLRLDRRRLPHYGHASRGPRAISCMKMALADAGLGWRRRLHQRARPSTAVNDRVESLAIKQVSAIGRTRYPYRARRA